MMIEQADEAGNETRESLPLPNIATAMWLHRVKGVLALASMRIKNILERIDDTEFVRSGLNQVLASLDLEVKTVSQDNFVASLETNISESLAPVSVNAVVRQVLGDYQQVVKSSDNTTRFDSDLAFDVPDAKANVGLLAEVIRVLIDNSLRAIESKVNPTILIGTGFSAGRIIIDVSDNGLGIPNEVAEKILREPVSGPSSGGLGLGLLLSRKLVTSWGGTITLVKSSRAGTTFRITLPQWSVSCSASSDLARALIVDDRQNWREILADIVKSSGMTVDSASDAKSAERLIYEHKYDLALVDMRLDESDPANATGVFVAQLIREHNPEAFIMMLTGYVSDDSVKKALAAGVDDVVEKTEFGRKGMSRLREQIAVLRKPRGG